MAYLDLYFLELFLGWYEPFDEPVNRTWSIVSGPDLARGAALTFSKRVEESGAHPAVPIAARSVGVSVPA